VTTNELVLAIHPVHAEAIFEGRKKLELRTRFPRVSPGTVVYLYATAPISAVVGGFIVDDVIEDSVAVIWANFGSLLGITEAEFATYAHGRSCIKAVRIQDTFRLTHSVSRQELKEVSDEYCPPQSAGFLRHHSVREHLRKLQPA